MSDVWLSLSLSLLERKPLVFIAGHGSVCVCVVLDVNFVIDAVYVRRRKCCVNHRRSNAPTIIYIPFDLVCFCFWALVVALK